MSELSAKKESELAAFRQAYADRLPARIDAIEEAWSVVCRAGHDQEHLDAVFYKVHNLHGSAAICGFRAVSDLAGALEAITKLALHGGVPTPEQQLEFAWWLDELKRVTRSPVCAPARIAVGEFRAP